MIIEYWSDYSCPYCYIAATRMKKAIRELGVQDECRIDFKTFRLNPNAKVIPQHTMLESFAHGYGISIEQAQSQIDRIESLGRDEGLDFRYGSSYNSNTFDALRLTKFAQSKGRAFGDAFIDRMYRAFFSDNLILGDRRVLLDIAEEMGLDRDEAAGVIDGADYANAVMDDERAARALGIRAVPFFIIGGYGIPGAVSTEDFKKVIGMALKEEDEGSLDMNGQACGPDGCH